MCPAERVEKWVSAEGQKVVSAEWVEKWVLEGDRRRVPGRLFGEGRELVFMTIWKIWLSKKAGEVGLMKQWIRAVKRTAISLVRCSALQCDLEQAREPLRLPITCNFIESTTIPTVKRTFKTKAVQGCQHDVDGRTALFVLKDAVSFADHGRWGQQEGRQGKECFFILF
jgi:hypothetical protein